MTAQSPSTSSGDSAAEQAPSPEEVTPPAEKDYGRAGRNLPAAIGVGVGIGGAVLASILIYPPAFLVVAVIGVLAATWELSTALSRSGADVYRPLTMMAAAGLVLSSWFGGREAVWVAFTLSAGIIMLVSLVTGRPNPVKEVSLSLFALTYVGLMAAFIIHILHQPQGDLLLITFLALAVSSDTGGYVFGVLWGKHPIAPRISPKKSWEGYAGSTVFAVTVGICMAVFAFDVPWWEGAVLGLVIPAFATLGDFSESMIKRDLDLKDMGNLLPGHGGVMDRLDSILPSAPVVLVLYTILPGFITTG